MAGRKPGAKKTGGRRRGVQNKVTRETKEALRDFIQNYQEDVAGWFDALDSPEKKIDRFIKLLEFVQPKMKSVEASHDVNMKGSGFTLNIQKTYESEPEAE